MGIIELERNIREYSTDRLKEVVGKKRHDFSEQAIEFAEDELILRQLKKLSPLDQVKYIRQIDNERLSFIINYSHINYPKTIVSLLENEYGKRGFEELEWYYLDNSNKTLGPVKLSFLKKLVSKGNLTPYSLIYKDGMETWTPAVSVAGLFDSGNPNLPPVPENIQNVEFYNENKENEELNQKLGCGLSVTCFLIPVVGLILYFTEKNQKGKTALNISIVSSILSTIFFLIRFFLLTQVHRY